MALALAINGAIDGAEDSTRAWLWVQDKAALRLSGRPYRPGLPLALRHRLIHVAANQPEDALFALEEGLRCRDLAFVLGELALLRPARLHRDLGQRPRHGARPCPAHRAGLEGRADQRERGAG